MLPMRPMTPAHASIASLSIVLPDDAWPTMAKFRRSPAEGVAITQNCSCSKHASNSPQAQAEMSGSLSERCGQRSRPSRAEIGASELNHLRQAARDARAPDQKCLLYARSREATRLLLRSLWLLQQKLERS